MKIHTFTIPVGTPACNMDCPYCVSKMTPKAGFALPKAPINWRNFNIACRAAQLSEVTTVLFTGKGEPTLYADQIKEYLGRLQQYSFPFIELQTNGIRLDPQCVNVLACAQEWYDMGMTLVCLSVAHYDAATNNALLRPNDPNFDFWRAADALHQIGFSVRVNCTLIREGVDSPDHLDNLIDRCHANNIEQITVRMVAKPDDSEDAGVADWVYRHQFPDDWVEEHIRKRGGVHLLSLPHGAEVYDVQGQNICVSTCLTGTADRDDIRQMIFFPGKQRWLRYDWRYEGAIIL